MNNYFIGIMTGTSADALDGCIVSFDEGFKFVESASISLDGDYKKNYEACIKAGYKTSSESNVLAEIEQTLNRQTVKLIKTLIDKSNRSDASEKVQDIGIDPNIEGTVSNTEEKTNAKKNNTKTNPEDWLPGMPLTSQLLSKLEDAATNNEIDPEFYALALPQAVKQGLIDGDTAKVKEVTNRLKKDLFKLKTNFKDVNPETLRDIKLELESSTGIDLETAVEEIKETVENRYKVKLEE